MLMISDNGPEQSETSGDTPSAREEVDTLIPNGEERRRFLRELAYAQERLLALSRTAAGVQVLLDPDRVLETIGRELRDQGLRCFFALLDESGERLTLRHVNLSEEQQERFRELTGTSLTGFEFAVDSSSFLQAVVDEGRAIFESDVPRRIQELLPQPTEALARQLTELLDAQRAITAPLVVGSEILGLLAVCSEHLAEADVPAISVLAQQAAAAIERAELYSDALQRVFEMEALRSTTLDMTRQLDLSRLLGLIVERAAALIGTKGGGLYLYDPTFDELEFAVSFNLGEDYTGTRLRPGEGLSGRVLQTGQILAIEDYSRWEHRSSKFDHPGFGGVLAAPMKWGDRILGVINVTDGSRPRTFSERDIWLLEWFANSAAVAIENARAFAEREHKIEQLAALHEVSLEVLAETDPSHLLMTIVQKATHLLKADAGAIDLFDPESQTLEMQVSHGYRNDYTGIRLSPGQGVAGTVCQTKQPLTIDDYALWPNRVGEIEEDEIRAALGVPLLRGAELLGVLTIDRSEPHPFNEEDLQLATLFANQAAIALDNARLYHEQRRRSEELLALHETSLDVVSRLELHNLLAAIIARAVQLLEGEAGDIYLYRPDSEDLISGASYRMPARVHGAIVKPGEGLSGRVLQTRAPLIVDDYDAWNGRSEMYAGYGFAHVMGVPITFGDQFLGVVVVERGHQSPSFTDRDQGLLTLFAHQAAVAIENSSLYEETKQKAEEVQALYEISTEIAGELELPSLLDTIVSRAVELLDARAGGAYLVDDDGQHLELAASRGLAKDYIGIRLRPGEGACGRVAQTGEPLLVRDYSGWEGRSQIFEDEPTNNVLAVPIKHAGTLLGAIWVDDSDLERAFDDGDLRLANLLANQAAIAIQNAQTVEAMRKRVTELSALREISLQLTRSLDPETVLDTIVNSAVRIVNASDVHIFLYDADRGEFTFGSGAWAPGKEMEPFTEVRKNGLTATVARLGEPVVINQAKTHPLFRDETDQDRIMEAIAGFPLKRGGNILGVFNVAFLEPHAFDDDELRVLTLLADQAAIAVENARLYQQTDRRLKESQTLQEVSQLLNSTLEPEQIMQTVVEKLASAFAYGMASIYVMKEDGLRLAAEVGYNTERAMSFIPLNRGVIGRVARSGEAEFVRDVSADPDFLAAAEDVACEIAAPIRRDHEVLGVLNVESVAESPLTDADLPLLNSLAHQVSVAIQNARLYQAAQRELADRKRAEDEYRSVVEHSLQGLVVVQDGRIVFANQALEGIVGYRAEELLSLSPDQVVSLVHPEDREMVWGRLRDRLAGEDVPPDYEYRGVRKDGGVVWIEMFANAVEYRGRPAVQAALLDITERKRAEEDLQRSYLDLRDTLEGTVSALAALAEARDPYTAGHQQRVAALACAIAKEMHLSDDAVEAIRMSGLVHDIGKIHVPAEILSKPTKLTDVEMQLIRTHPQTAYEILRTVKFTGPVGAIVLQHHERMDGSGYPHGLKGEDILLEARILAVADVVEAMASNRPYRPAHGIDEALAEISRNTKSLYDAEAARACLRLFKKKGFDLRALHS
jgi:PAS domain S-box-containing protein/putative nucleotidyltransferase with HDIG domain